MFYEQQGTVPPWRCPGSSSAMSAVWLADAAVVDVCAVVSTDVPAALATEASAKVSSVTAPNAVQ